MNKSIVILGSTGSVGTQAADVARAQGYGVRALSANKNAAAAEAQIREFRPVCAAMTDETAAKDLAVRVRDLPVRVYAGKEGLSAMIAETEADVFVNAVSGFAGLRPTLDCIENGRALALANKESLVIAGDIVMQRVQEKKIRLTPVDSEHSAIFQCLRAGKHGEVRKILLTASGGPFFGKTREELRHVSAKEALSHPNWKMGPEITVDSATLMNKGFEVIEASKLFSVPGDRIETVVHRESIVHSMVQFADNAVIAQMSVPDMRLCVQYAVEHPRRRPAVIEELDLCRVGTLHFAKPDTDTFAPLSLAYEALKQGGAMPAVLHAANEVAVGAFLQGKCGFLSIMDTLRYVFDRTADAAGCRSLDEILAADTAARALAAQYLKL